MEKLTSAELRSIFLDFFRERGHEVLGSSPLVPVNDPSLLFTNAGMVQFKDIFLGRESRPYSTAVTSQRCVRAGGKHNDLENVGYTARHHTFFEMLGNFSFGDYFKDQAIRYSWELLTEVYQIPSERLWITVFDEDREAESIWLDKVKVDPARFSRVGAKDNFWSMGEVGPCGPCTEIFYDHGENISGGPPGSPDADGDRFVEIWNLVFMQYERAADGVLSPLPKPSVDTGMGLERLAAVIQGVHNNYDIDVFKKLIRVAAQLAKTKDLSQNSLRVIADHIRSCSFLVCDGVIPSNEGRGYVLRRIIRRAIRHGYNLGISDLFFYKLVEPLCAEMGHAYPELVSSRETIKRTLKNEEQRFAETLNQGMKILESCAESLTSNVIPGDVVFQLYDTHGFPVDLTCDFARENALRVDMLGFEAAMEEQRQRARKHGTFTVDYLGQVKSDACTEFTGYNKLNDDSIVVGLYGSGESCVRLDENESGIIILDRTPFYAESGGQVGDKGIIQTPKGVFEVADTRKQGANLVLHHGTVSTGTIHKDDRCVARVDFDIRQATALNHSATHLLHAALRAVLGKHVTQKGSLVDADRLRFDFSHDRPLRKEEIREIEILVNFWIRLNTEVTAEIMPKDQAMAAGAVALFGEKYDDEVRVLKIGEFSTELCGGTHVSRSGDIGIFKIVGETGVAAGIRRLEAVTGQAAIDWIEAHEKLLERISGFVKGARESVEGKVRHLVDQNRQMEKEIQRLKAKLASGVGTDLTNQAIDISGVKVLAARLDDVDAKAMRDTVDQLKNKLGSAVIVLATVIGDKVNIVAGVTKDKMDEIKAGDLVNHVATKVGGKGGGRADMAQAGGNDPSRLEAALKEMPDWVRARLD